MSVNYTKIKPLYSNKKVGILGENYRKLLLARPKHPEQKCHIGYLLANQQGNQKRGKRDKDSMRPSGRKRMRQIRECSSRNSRNILSSRLWQDASSKFAI